ncbi:MATE family efflux transporter [Ideonella sp. YS5]|uniref:MATE family efflux transporter n=1 Tax=Ideonella sp. YS5 TaxID=3453714 RepID=UPI003EEC2C2A
MKDLTQGPIRGHIVAMATPIAVGMLVQTLYFLVDLYFVSRLGPEAIAGVSQGGNAVMIVIALTQMLSVGTVALISHAVGAREHARAELAFNQSLGLAIACTLFALALGLAGIQAYMSAVGATEGIAEAGRTYLLWYLPGLALQFPLAAMGSAMRGTGVAKPGMVVQMLTVLVNIVLAPILIAGWGTGHPMGVMGAGLASSLAVAAGVLMMVVYFVRLESYVSVRPMQMLPRWNVWKPLLRIGVPAGGEFFLMFLYTSAIYWLIRGFGPAAQAGFGIGLRVMQAVFLPAMAISFALPAVAGQNFGARRADRVRETLKQGVIIECSLMLLLAIACHLVPESMIGAFTSDPAVAEVGVGFLTIISTNFVAMGFVFACSGLFQAMGNTWPAMASTATRLVTFVGPAVWLSQRPGFALRQVWFLSVATVLLQALVSGLLVRWQLRQRLQAFDVLAREGTVPAAT